MLCAPYLNRRSIFSDRGSALVDFILVVPVLISTFVAVGEITMLVHHRAVLTAALEQGVRAASVSNGSMAIGKARAQAVLKDHGVALDSVGITLKREIADGAYFVTGTIERTESVFGTSVTIKARSRSLDESKL